MRRIGDTVFSQSGKPGVIVGRTEDQQRIKVEREGERFEKTRKHGYINGLSGEEKSRYESIVSEVQEIEGAKDKVSALKGHLDELKTNPKNMRLAKYVEADLAHTMISHGLHPKVYESDEHHVR